MRPAPELRVVGCYGVLAGGREQCAPTPGLAVGGTWVVRAELCSNCDRELCVCACVRARVWSSLEVCVCVCGGTVGCGGRAPLTPFFPPTPLIPFREHGFQDPPGLLLLSPWLRGGGGRRQLGPAAAPAAPAHPHGPFSPFHRQGPIPCCSGGQGPEDGGQ